MIKIFYQFGDDGDIVPIEQAIDEDKVFPEFKIGLKNFIEEKCAADGVSGEFIVFLDNTQGRDSGAKIIGKSDNDEYAESINRSYKRKQMYEWLMRWPDKVDDYLSRCNPKMRKMYEEAIAEWGNNS